MFQNLRMLGWLRSTLVKFLECVSEKNVDKVFQNVCRKRKSRMCLGKIRKGCVQNIKR